MAEIISVDSIVDSVAALTVDAGAVAPPAPAADETAEEELTLRSLVSSKEAG